LANSKESSLGVIGQTLTLLLIQSEILHLPMPRKVLEVAVLTLAAFNEAAFRSSRALPAEWHMSFD
jgi:hypothetical protein